MSARSQRSWGNAGAIVRTAAAPAPAAFLATWGVLVIVLLTNPIRPYTDGVWTSADLLSLGVVGGLIGLVSRPVAAAVGIVLGAAAAVAIQLYVLAGHARYLRSSTRSLRQIQTSSRSGSTLSPSRRPAPSR